MDFISREAWGAQYAAGSGPRAIPTAECWLHHSVTLAPDSTDDDEAAAMRTIERIGQQRFKAGFSYNLAVMPSGRVYVGCGVRRVGTHTGGRNTKALGIVLVGNYEDNPMPRPMQDAVVNLLREAHVMGWIDRPAFDGGHRDLKQTACPGIQAYRLIPTFNRLAAQPPAKPLPGTTPTPTTVQEDIVARLIKTADDPTVWATDGLHRWHVVNQDVLGDLRATGVYGDGKVHTVSALTVDALVLVTGDTNTPSPYAEQPPSETPAES